MCISFTFLIYSHIDSENTSSLSNSGYNCPQCGSRYCELPVECKQCGLTLVSAPHLARSYHHLFPIKPFTEREHSPDLVGTVYCFACAKLVDESEKHVSFLAHFLLAITQYYILFFFG